MEASSSRPARIFRSLLEWKIPAAPLVALLAILAAYFTDVRRQANSHGSDGQPAAIDPASLGAAAVTHCRAADARTRPGCYGELLEVVAASTGARAGLSALRAILVRDSAAQNDAHMLAHQIGFAALQETRDPASVFVECSAEFHSGCFHGVLQSLFASRPRVDAAQVKGLCTELTAPRPSTWLYFQCLHGLGHGLTIRMQYDLGGALRLCDALSSDWERESCYAGAFMENVVRGVDASGAHHHSGHSHGETGAAAAAKLPPARAEDPQYPCSEYPDRYKGACYLIQTAVMLRIEKGDFARVARDCAAAPRRFRGICFQSLGRDASGAGNQMASKIISICSALLPEEAPWCYFGAAKDVVYRKPSLGDGLQLCAEVAGAGNRLKCFEAVGEQAAVLIEDPRERMTFCGEVEPAYRATCEDAAQARPPS
jgi:hypothetical protein